MHCIGAHHLYENIQRFGSLTKQSQQPIERSFRETTFRLFTNSNHRDSIRTLFRRDLAKLAFRFGGPNVDVKNDVVNKINAAFDKLIINSIPNNE